jgi:tetratricopeptide (TPR) repeat protein
MASLCRVGLYLALASLPASAGAQQASSGSPSIYVTAAEARQHLLHQVDPAFPTAAQGAHIEGMVDLQLAIDESGRPTVTLISGDPLLAPAAIEAAAQWRYQPFEKDGTPVAVTTALALWIPSNSHQTSVQRENEFLSTYWPARSRGIDDLNDGDFSTAAKELLIARSAAQGRGDAKWHELALVCAALGGSELGLKKYQEAERFYKESLDLYNRHGEGEHAEAGDTMEEFANLYAAQNESDKAEPLLATTSFWLVAIGTSSHRLDMAGEHCKDLVEYATQYMEGGRRDTMLRGCAEVDSQLKQ